VATATRKATVASCQYERGNDRDVANDDHGANQIMSRFIFKSVSAAIAEIQPPGWSPQAMVLAPENQN